MKDQRDQSANLRAAIRDGNAMRAARAARKARAEAPTTAIICGGTEDDRRRMAAWVKEELRHG